MSSMYVFRPKRECPICHVLLTVQNTHYSSTTDNSLDLYTNKSSIYRHKPIVTYWALKKHQALLAI